MEEELMIIEECFASLLICPVYRSNLSGSTKTTPRLIISCFIVGASGLQPKMRSERAGRTRKRRIMIGKRIRSRIESYWTQSNGESVAAIDF
jgi:hypothetical protein